MQTWAANVTGWIHQQRHQEKRPTTLQHAALESFKACDRPVIALCHWLTGTRPLFSLSCPAPGAKRQVQWGLQLRAILGPARRLSFNTNDDLATDLVQTSNRGVSALAPGKQPLHIAEPLRCLVQS